jgi:sensor histidine kinase YesM
MAARRSSLKTWWRELALIFGCYTIISLMELPLEYPTKLHPNLSMTLGQTFADIVYSNYIWAIATPLMIWLARRFPIDREYWKRNLPLHVCFGFLVIVLIEILYRVTAWMVPQHQWPYYKLPFWHVVGMVGAADLVTYGVTVAIAHAVIYFDKYRDRERKLAQSQLTLLRMQLNPHFLFNTLNAISRLGYRDPAKADEVIERLSDLLRSSLRTDQAQEITLNEELRFVRQYLEIQRILLGDRLKIQYDVVPSTLTAKVPNMMLQPLVENAIKFAIAPRSEGGLLEIRSERAGDSLKISISDDGPGLENNSVIEESGVGLANTRARLEQLYGSQQSLELTGKPSQGLQVMLTIPYREAEIEVNEALTYAYR